MKKYVKQYVLYHGNCYDGFGAAFAAWLKWGEAAEYIPVLYGKPLPKIDPLSDVVIADFSYPADVLLKLGETAKTVVVLDHHATAQADLLPEKFLSLLGNPKIVEDDILAPDGFYRFKNVWVKFDMNKSGAVLAWEYFHQDNPVPEFFYYLQDRDLWQFKLPRSREVSTALRSHPMTFEFWKQLLYHPMGMESLRREGVACLRLTNQQVEIMAKNHRIAVFSVTPKAEIEFFTQPIEGKITEGSGHVAPVANATVFFSEVGEKLLEMYPDAPFAAYYLDRADGMRQWGLRSREGFDCSVIAKAFGGGGHKQASGFVQKL